MDEKKRGKSIADKPLKKVKDKEQPRSLTEQEYEDIFNGVLQEAMSDARNGQSSSKDEENRQQENEHEESDSKSHGSLSGSDSEGDKDETNDDEFENRDAESIASEAIDEWDDDSIQDTNETTPHINTTGKVHPAKKDCQKTKKENKLKPKQLFSTKSENSNLKPKVKNNLCRTTHSKGSKNLFNGNPKNPALCLQKEKAKEEEEEEEEGGTWVQCSNQDCKKWRYLSETADPSDIPQIWECSMNTDEEHNSCNYPEVNYDESDHIFTKYTVGSVVWAKMNGYPWWPAMVEIDPDYDTYFELPTETSMVPTQYHVSFFDDSVSRAWIKVFWLSPYIKGNDKVPKVMPLTKRSTHTREVKAAARNADKALELRLEDRLKIYGFSARYSKGSKVQKKRKANVRREKSKGRKSEGEHDVDKASEQYAYEDGLDKDSLQDNPATDYSTDQSIDEVRSQRKKTKKISPSVNPRVFDHDIFTMELGTPCSQEAKVPGVCSGLKTKKNAGKLKSEKKHKNIESHTNEHDTQILDDEDVAKIDLNNSKVKKKFKPLMIKDVALKTAKKDKTEKRNKNPDCEQANVKSNIKRKDKNIGVEDDGKVSDQDNNSKKNNLFSVEQLKSCNSEMSNVVLDDSKKNKPKKRTNENENNKTIAPKIAKLSLKVNQSDCYSKGEKEKIETKVFTPHDNESVNKGHVAASKVVKSISEGNGKESYTKNQDGKDQCSKPRKGQNKEKISCLSQKHQTKTVSTYAKAKCTDDFIKLSKNKKQLMNLSSTEKQYAETDEEIIQEKNTQDEMGDSDKENNTPDTSEIHEEHEQGKKSDKDDELTDEATSTPHIQNKKKLKLITSDKAIFSSGKEKIEEHFDSKDILMTKSKQLTKEKSKNTQRMVKDKIKRRTKFLVPEVDSIKKGKTSSLCDREVPSSHNENERTSSSHKIIDMKEADQYVPDMRKEMDVLEEDECNTIEACNSNEAIEDDESDSNEEELDLGIDISKVEETTPHILCDDDGSDDDFLDLEIENDNKNIDQSAVERPDRIHGRFGGTCCEHGSDSDPLELIED